MNEVKSKHLPLCYKLLTHSRKFILCFYPTECTYRHHVELDGQFLSLDVLDTAGKVSIPTNRNVIQ